MDFMNNDMSDPDFTPAYKHVESLSPGDIGRMMWHGWAIREAFIAGALHAKATMQGHVLTKPNKMFKIKVEYHFAEGYPFRDGVLPETYDTIEEAVQALTGEPVGQAPGNCTHDGDGKFSWPTGYQLCEGEHMRPDYYLVSAASGRVTKPIKEYCNESIQN